MVTLQEWAAYIGVSKNTVIAWMKKYDKAKFEYDPRNIYSVFNFNGPDKNQAAIAPYVLSSS